MTINHARHPYCIRLLQAAILAAGVLSNLATGDGGGDTPPPPKLKFKQMLVTPQQALPNQAITVSWDYDSPEKLKSQWMEVISLTIQGQMLRSVEGRPVTASGGVEPGFENHPVMAMDVRQRAFTFTGPVTVAIGAQDTDGKILRAAVDVTLQNAFLRVSLSPIQDLETQQPNLTYPRVLSSSKPETLEFPVFFGTYDEPPSATAAPNGVIDFFQRLGVRLGGDSRAFFARSYLDAPDNRFGFDQGINFPRLEADYLHLSADAIDRSQNRRFEQLGGQYLVADGMLIGAKIVYHGEVLVTKGPAGDVTSQTGALSMEPVFFEIDFRSEKDGAIHVVDMHLGNVPQGFVASGYSGLTAGRALNAQTLPATSYDFSGATGLHQTGRFTGAVGTSKLGFNAGGYPRYIQVDEARWQNVPFFSDYDLSGANLTVTR